MPSRSRCFKRAGIALTVAALMGGCASPPFNSPRTAGVSPGQCTYETWDWDVIHRRSVNRHEVVKDRDVLTPEEIGQVPGCTVCREDQTEIRLAGVAPFSVCRILADRVRTRLGQALAEGFPLLTVVGYRVGKSKGNLNADGLRTEFSNHSYGTALDVNSGLNGLYDHCPRFAPGCRLLHGGPYRQDAPGSVTPGSPVYRAMLGAGLKWGGEIEGDQKDFMHFSPTGM